MGSFIMINTDDLDSLKVALNTRVHGMCETAPIDAGERLMNVINKFTSGGTDTSDEIAVLPIDSVMQSALPNTPDDEIYDAAAELYKAGKMLNATLLVKRHTTMNPAQAKRYCDAHFA